MKLAEFDKICGQLPGAAMVVQWGDSHVHKVGGKVFAIGNAESGTPSFVFKTTPLSYQLLLEQSFATRAPYLPRGNWVQVSGAGAMTDADLIQYIRQSYKIVVGTLPAAKRTSLDPA